MSFTIYQASAGSGKTFSLAKEYLKITLQHPELYKNILAITFTNKAAAEMKERILSYLSDIDSGNPSSDGFLKMLPLVVEETGMGRETAIANASILLKKIIYGYADFSVMTIDAFYQRILRTFAYDLDIPLNFQLEIDYNDLIDQVVDLLIEQVGENENLTKMMIDFVNSRSEESKSWHVEKEIVGFTPELFREQSKFFIDALQNLSLSDFNDIINRYIQEKKDLKLQVAQSVAAMQRLLDQQGILAKDFNLSFLAKWFATVEKEEYTIGATLKKVMKNQNWFAKNKSALASSFQAIEAEFVPLLEQSVEYARKILFIAAIQKKIFPMALLNELKGMLSQIESIEHTFQISNTNFKLNEITSQEVAPFIYERLGDKYYYYFIDEFQDTSRLQWLNILPLICEALSGYHGQNKGRAILFGDPKQAIYRFRGGDIEQFVSLPLIPNPEMNPIIEQMESTVVSQYQSIPLGTNYRSLQKIVEFNNDLFGRMAADYSCIGQVYKGHRQDYLTKNAGGLITITIQEKSKEVKFPDFALAQIRQRVEEALQNGFSLKDIAILTRDKKHSPEIASYLSRSGYAVISSDSLLVQSSLKVLFITSLLRYYENGDHQVMAYSMYVKYCQVFGFQMEWNSISLLDFAWFEAFFTSKGYTFSFESLKTLRLYEKLEYVVRVFGFDAESDVYLLALLNVMDGYMQSQKPEHKFWEWWDDNSEKLSVEIPQDMDGVNLLTIHKSKGLEYPIVIFPDYSSSNSKNNLWVKLADEETTASQRITVAQLPVKEDDDTDYSTEVKEELDRIVIDKVNILYVALTRAVERLHLIIPTPPDKSKSFSYKAAIAAYVNDSMLFEKEEGEGCLHYTFGDFESKKGAPKSLTSDEIEVRSLKSFDWKSRNWLSVGFQESEAQLFGKMLHQAMALIQNHADVTEALALAKRQYHLDEKATATLKISVESILGHEKLSRLFDAGVLVYNEVDVVDEEGRIYRPDRVVCVDDEAIILDFKTGLQQEYYFNQVTLYKDIYIKLGYQKVLGFLVYCTSSGIEIVEV